MFTLIRPPGSCAIRACPPRARVVFGWNHLGDRNEFLPTVHACSRPARFGHPRPTSGHRPAATRSHHAAGHRLGSGPWHARLVLPDAIAQWTLTTLREKLVKIGAGSSG